jgi:tRNA(fMet)-specific endonuclease VapC
MSLDYLLDTNALSDLMADHPKVRLKVANQSGQLGTSVIARGEIYYGIERLTPGQRRSNLKLKADAVLAVLPHEPITQAVADKYAFIRRETELRGVTLDDNDLWLGATAVVVGAAVVTRDKDFAFIPGLKVEDWTQ